MFLCDIFHPCSLTPTTGMCFSLWSWGDCPAASVCNDIITWHEDRFLKVDLPDHSWSTFTAERTEVKTLSTNTRTTSCFLRERENTEKWSAIKNRFPVNASLWSRRTLLVKYRWIVALNLISFSISKFGSYVTFLSKYVGQMCSKNPTSSVLTRPCLPHILCPNDLWPFSHLPLIILFLFCLWAAAPLSTMSTAINTVPVSSSVWSRVQAAIKLIVGPCWWI